MSYDSRFSVDQDDGSQWDVFHSGRNPEQFVIHTAAGKEVMLHDPSYRPAIHDYRHAVQGDHTSPDTRQLLGQGQQAKVYTMGKRYAVRETPGVENFYTGISELGKMNTLTDLVDQGTPRWLRTPEHFLRLSDPTHNTTYTVMNRIDDGVTVEDVLNFPDTPRAEAVVRNFGEVGDETREKARSLFDRAHNILTTLIERSGVEVDHILTDWETRNALIHPIRTPIAGEHHLLHVIDQY